MLTKATIVKITLFATYYYFLLYYHDLLFKNFAKETVALIVTWPTFLLFSSFLLSASCSFKSTKEKKMIRPENENLATTHPDLALEYMPPPKNILQANEVYAKTHKKVWWKCLIGKACGHEWVAQCCSRTGSRTNKKGRGCPVCAGKVKANKKISEQAISTSGCFQALGPQKTATGIIIGNHYMQTDRIFFPKLKLSLSRSSDLTEESLDFTNLPEGDFIYDVKEVQVPIEIILIAQDAERIRRAAMKICSSQDEAIARIMYGEEYNSKAFFRKWYGKHGLELPKYFDD